MSFGAKFEIEAKLFIESQFESKFEFEIAIKQKFECLRQSFGKLPFQPSSSVHNHSLKLPQWHCGGRGLCEAIEARSV